jgi:Ca2+-binding RTX toxin-like protein
MQGDQIPMRDLRLRGLLLAALASIGVMALPAVASATVDFTVPAPDTLAVTSDGAGDTITLTVDAANGHYFVNDGTLNRDTGLTATATSTITVDAADGDDTVDATALATGQYGALTIHGGAGGDTIRGGASTAVRDQVFGDDGVDAVNGFRGNDDQFGGTGDDALIWNNGDGNDTSDGGSGNDTILFNGAPVADTIAVTSPDEGLVNVHRSVPNTIDVDGTRVEEVDLNGLAGNDTLSGADGLAAVLTEGLVIDGGADNDTVTGGDGDDDLSGGDGADTLNGGDGIDLVAGGHQDDTMNGGPGDDTLSWSNGDGNDITNGDEGFDTTEVNEGAANEVNTITLNGARTMFARTAGAPAFTMDMDTEETEVNTSDGNDSVTVGPGVGAHQIVVADGGNGDDTLLGGDEADILRGGPGNDTLDAGTGAAIPSVDGSGGGVGSDLLAGEEGDDILRSERNAAGSVGDAIQGGAGDDIAVVDPSDDLDELEHVVTINAAVAPATISVAGGAGDETLSVSTVDPTYTVGINGIDLDTGVTVNAASPITVDGGAGDDTVDASGLGAGQYGSLTLRGGDGTDTLTGGGGGDFIAGGHGPDTMNGGPGNDTLSWSNGDNNDVTNGDGGFDVTEVLEGAANDVNAVTPNGARTKFERTAGAPNFTMDMDTEALSLRTFGGIDALTVAAGVGQAIVVDAGAGDDTLTGGSEADSFFGGPDNDTLDGGTGVDLLDGQEGNDTLKARDGFGDLVRGGLGDDSAVVDLADVVDGVEHVDAPVVTPPAGPGDVKAFAATVSGGKVRVVSSHGRLVAKVPVSCPVAETGGCAATLTLQTARAVRVGGLRVVLVLGSKRVSLKGGQRATVSVTLIGGAARLASHGRIAARASIVSHDAAGNVATSSRAVSLAVPRVRRR